MQLTEFKEEVLKRAALPRGDSNHIPPYFVQRMIDSAEAMLPWKQEFYNDHPVNYADFLEDTYKLGGLCAWIGPDGTILPLIYGGHSHVRDCFVNCEPYGGSGNMDRHWAHVSVHDCSIHGAVRNITEGKVTRKMLHSIYRFYLTVHMLPESQMAEPARQPYRWAMPEIEEINRNPRFERDIITVIPTAEWESMTNSHRLVNDLSMVSYWAPPPKKETFIANTIQY